MNDQQQHTTTATNTDDEIEIPVISQHESQVTAFLATIACSFIDLVPSLAKNLLPNSRELYFRCRECEGAVYVYEQFRMFQDFPTCQKCSRKSFQEHLESFFSW
jgi:hypothetical protein